MTSKKYFTRKKNRFCVGVYQKKSSTKKKITAQRSHFIIDHYHHLYSLFQALIGFNPSGIFFLSGDIIISCLYRRRPVGSYLGRCRLVGRVKINYLKPGQGAQVGTVFDADVGDVSSGSTAGAVRVLRSPRNRGRHLDVALNLVLMVL